MPYTNIGAATAAVTTRFYTGNLKNGAYAVANPSASWAGGFLIAMTHSTVAAGTDALPTITFVGTSLSGQAQTEVLQVLADQTVTSTKIFRTLTSQTGAGWTIAGGNDTIVIGNAAGCYCVDGPGRLDTLLINAAAAATIVVADGKGTIQTIPSNQAAGTAYEYDLGVEGYLKVTTTSTNDITIIHSLSVATTYAMS